MAGHPVAAWQQRRRHRTSRTPVPLLRDVARWRQGAYRLLATLLMPPSPRSIDAFPQAVRFLETKGRWTVTTSFHGAWQRLARETRGLTRGDLPVLQIEHESVFGRAAGERPIPLCETEFLVSASGAAGAVLADLERAYAAAGLKPIRSRHEQADHAAVELEFVSSLCGGEADAWESEDAATAVHMMGRERHFLDAHLSPWIPPLAQMVSRRDAGGLYAATTLAAWALVAHDADLLRLLGATVGPAPVLAGFGVEEGRG